MRSAHPLAGAFLLAFAIPALAEPAEKSAIEIKTRAAEILGIPAKTLYDKLARFSIAVTDFKT